MYLFIDTETTGVGKNSRSVQIAWVLADSTGRELVRRNAIVYPEGFSTISKGALETHGITIEKARRVGVPLREILIELKRALIDVDGVIGHNISFDLNILRNDARAVGIDLSFDGISKICTMHASTRWCGIPNTNGRRGFKRPSLQELHRRCFGAPFDGAHDALADILATKDCFFYLLEKGVIEKPEHLNAFVNSQSEQANARKKNVEPPQITPLRSEKTPVQDRIERLSGQSAYKGTLPAKPNSPEGRSSRGSKSPSEESKKFHIEKAGRRVSPDTSLNQSTASQKRSKQSYGSRPNVVAEKFRIEKVGKAVGLNASFRQSTRVDDHISSEGGNRPNPVPKKFRKETIGPLKSDIQQEAASPDNRFARTSLTHFQCYECRQSFIVTLSRYEKSAHCPNCFKICTEEVRWN